MIDPNLLSYGFSVVVLLIGVVSFLMSGFRTKYLSASVVLSVGSRLAYWAAMELKDSVPIAILIFVIGFFIIGILFSGIDVALSNDGRTKSDVNGEQDE